MLEGKTTVSTKRSHCRRCFVICSFIVAVRSVYKSVEAASGRWSGAWFRRTDVVANGRLYTTLALRLQLLDPRANVAKSSFGRPQMASSLYQPV